ncbi:MAG: zinc ribbon domain-containing protein [Chroococcidiopsidaceae cyanobacterium CP_BM_ER_R8_30]|nr:zinc ribbon domain-containing protein [Chroococcidiopsidaceae cyanobacterium CP_BM_ER_R8_30]
MSQGELAKKAGIHLQSLGKIELGKTARLSTKTTTGLSRALQIPQEYLEAVCKGVSVASVQQMKICPHCWVPGTEAEAIWLNPRSKYCFACGMKLSARCLSCNGPILSLKFRFCPLCGVPYKAPEKLARMSVK